MSKQSNQIVTIWKDIEFSTRCIVESEPLVKGDNDTGTCCCALTLWTLLTLDLLTSVRRFSTRWIQPLFHSMKDIGFIECIRLLKEADFHFILYLEENLEYPRSYDDFKRHLRNECGFPGILLMPIKPLLEICFSDETLPGVMQIRSYFSFLSRLSLRERDDLEQEALVSYLENEVLVQSVSLNDDLSDIMEEWFPRKCRHFIFDHFVPKHGPGAVADANRDVSDKYQNMRIDSLLRYFLNHVDDEKTVIPRPWLASPRDFRSAEVVFVPKTATKLRTICKEPTSLQWSQQGVLAALRDYVENHSYLRKRIQLRPRKGIDDPQSPNRDLAWIGSIDGSFATIDLSAASDSVSWELVRRSFQHTGLRECLWCTRSISTTLPDGTTIPNGKFAPMGSALCFPVECIVFAGIIEKTLRKLGVDPYQSWYRVFGDDIIIETQFVGPVIESLEEFGFRVNVAKSFFGTNLEHYFRESCGGDFLDGVNVTPLRIPRNFSGCRLDTHHPGRIEGLVSLANDAKDFPNVRRYVIHQLNRLPKKLRVPFSYDGASGICSDSCTNWHLHSKWNEDFQAVLFTHGFSKVTNENPLEVEDIRLFEHLRQTQTRRTLTWPDDMVHVEVGPRVSLRWKSIKDIQEGSYVEKP